MLTGTRLKPQLPGSCEALTPAGASCRYFGTWRIAKGLSSLSAPAAPSDWPYGSEALRVHPPQDCGCRSRPVRP